MNCGLRGAREALGQELRQVVGQTFAQFVRGGELLVGSGILGADAIEQPLQAGLARRGGRLEVDQPGFLARELVFVLQAGHLHRGRDPAIALPVEAHEDIALRQIGPVEFTRRVGTRT